MLNSPLFSKQSQSGHLWYYITHCAALAGLTGHHVAPLVSKYIPPTQPLHYILYLLHTKMYYLAGST